MDSSSETEIASHPRPSAAPQDRRRDVPGWRAVVSTGCEPVGSPDAPRHLGGRYRIEHTRVIAPKQTHRAEPDAETEPQQRASHGRATEAGGNTRRAMLAESTFCV